MPQGEVAKRISTVSGGGNARWDGGLVRASLLQAFFFMAFGAGIPFFSLHFKHLLVSDDASPALHLIGIIFLLNGVIGIFSTPIMGYLGDRFKVGRHLLAFCSVLVALTGVLLIIPGTRAGASWSLGRRFVFLLVGYGLNGLFFRPIVPLINTETLNSLHRRYASGTDYGRIRLFGSAGWIVSVSAVGWALSRSGDVNHALMGYAAGFLVLSAISSSGFRARLKQARIPWEHLKEDRYFRRFLVYAALYSFGFTGSFIYTGYFMEDLRTDYLIIGLSIGLSALPEIPLMYNSRRFIEKMGNRNMILVGAAFMEIKLLAFVLIARFERPILFIPAQLLHGAGWAFHYIGMVDLADTRAHPDLRTTYQGLLQVFMLIGGTIGNFVGPMIIHGLDSTWLMRINAGILVLAIVYFVSILGYTPGCEREETP